MRRLVAGTALVVVALAACGSSGGSTKGGAEQKSGETFSTWTECLDDASSTLAECREQFPNQGTTATTSTTLSTTQCQQLVADVQAGKLVQTVSQYEEKCGPVPFGTVLGTTTTTIPFVLTLDGCHAARAAYSITTTQDYDCRSLEYDSIQPGMTLDQVRAVVGGIEGTQESLASAGGYTIETWTLGPAIVSFQNGRMTAKVRRP